MKILLSIITTIIEEKNEELPISQNKICENLKLGKITVSKCINKLIHKNIIQLTEHSIYTLYSIKEIKEWEI